MYTYICVITVVWTKKNELIPPTPLRTPPSYRMNVGHRLTAGKGSAAAARSFLCSRFSTTTRSAPESALSSHVDEEDGFPRMVDVGEKVSEE